MDLYFNKIKDFVANLLPQSKLLNEFNGNFTFLVPVEGLKISMVFDQIELRKEQLYISDWGIS